MVGTINTKIRISNDKKKKYIIKIQTRHKQNTKNNKYINII